MATIVFVTIGSWGDLFPFVGVGTELAARGHRVRVAASPAWSDVVRDANLELVPIGRRIGFGEIAEHPEIFRRVPFGLRHALDRFLFDQAEELTRDLTGVVDEADLVVSHPAHLIAHNIAEASGTPNVIATVFPSGIRSAHTVPGGTPVGPWSGPVGRLANRASWVSASVATAALFDRRNNQHRRTLGLPRIRGGLLRATERACATVVMAAPAVVGHPPDWPDHVVVTSFVEWDRAPTTPITDATEAFLAAGAPPVLVTLGASSGVDAGDFFDQVVAHIAGLGARALVITGPAAAPVHHSDAQQVHVAAFEPFSLVASRCRAAIHHAGIGTTVSALRAGIPQLAVPRGFDQPVTAELIEDLGVGIAVPWRRRRRRLPSGIQRLLSDEALHAAASELQTRIEPDGVAQTCDAIEARLRTPPLEAR